MGRIVGLIINERLEPQKTEALTDENNTEEVKEEKPNKKGGKK